MVLNKIIFALVFLSWVFLCFVFLFLASYFFAVQIDWTVGLKEKTSSTSSCWIYYRMYVCSQSFVFHHWQEIKRIVTRWPRDSVWFLAAKENCCHQLYPFAAHWKFLHECGFQHSVLHFKVIISFWDRMRVCICSDVSSVLFFFCHWMKTTLFGCWNERL